MTAPDKDMRDPRRDEVIAGEYVLGALSAEDRRKVERRLAEDRRFAAMVSRWERNLAGSPEEPRYRPPPRRPAAVPQAQASAVRPSGGGYWNSLAFWRSLALASLMAAAAFAVAATTPAGETIAPEDTSTTLRGD